jgi:hypothetical protein
LAFGVTRCTDIETAIDIANCVVATATVQHTRVLRCGEEVRWRARQAVRRKVSIALGAAAIASIAGVV